MEFFISLARRARQSSSARNFAWLVADRGIRLLVGIGVTAWVARYLGKTDFGALNYSLAMVMIASAVAPLGMDLLAVREVVRKPSEAGRFIGTIIGFRFCGALILLLGVAVALNLMRPGQSNLLLLLAILAFGVLGQSLESGEIWFQARIEMRRLVVPRLIVYTLCNIVKIGLILKGCSVYWFAVMTSTEQILCGVITCTLVRRALRGSQTLSFSLKEGLGLLSESWPLALSGIAVIIYMKAGLIMIGNLLGNEAVGLYTCAIKVPEVFLFIPMVLASSMLPNLLAAQKAGPASYQAAALRFMRLNAIISLAAVLPMSILAPWIVRFLFGEAFAAAGLSMSIYSWSLVFVFLGVARGQFLLNEKRTFTSFCFSTSGMILNLTLNSLLIPRFGVNGAAVSGVLTYAVAGFLASFALPHTRALGLLQFKALVTPWLAFRHLNTHSPVPGQKPA